MTQITVDRLDRPLVVHRLDHHPLLFSSRDQARDESIQDALEKHFYRGIGTLIDPNSGPAKQFLAFLDEK